MAGWEEIGGWEYGRIGRNKRMGVWQDGKK